MMAARSASIAFLALILTVAALVFPKSTWAASGNVQICNPSASCTIGEFLYNDSYSPITSGATCTITSRFPDGSLFLNAVSMPASAQGDGWYAHTFTTPSTLGLYRTEVKCVIGSDTMALDKSFEVQTPPSTLTSNDVASAVWGYSSRSLTTFGSLVSDIWNNVTRTITNVTNISNITQEIKNINEDNRALLERIINRPSIESSLEYDSGFNIQSKIDTTKSISNKLLTQIRYLKSKTGVIDHRWDSLNEDQLSDRLSKLAMVADGISVEITKLKSLWSKKEVDTSIKQAKDVKSKILTLEKNINKNAKSKSTQKELKSLYQAVAKLEASVEKNLLASIDKINQQVLVLDTKSSDADQILKNWNPLDLIEISKKIANLAKDVSEINLIPKTNNLLTLNKHKDYSEKELKNKVLGIKGVLGANKKLLAAEDGKPLSQLWLEEGSIVFKILITNPSSKISQTVPVKYYLPEEVKKENIVKADEGLIVDFDAEKNRYFLSGEFVLAAGESKTISVTVDDSVFHIPDDDIAVIRTQVVEFSKPLENTAYFAQTALLKSDINASLNKIESLQKNSLTPEAKIRAYREASIEYKAAKEKLEKLKEITTQAHSVGTLFGFVGGAQASAVWGLIIIMAAGFVFLTLYVRLIRKDQMVIAESLTKSAKKKVIQEEIQKPLHDGKGLFHHYKMAAFIIIGIISLSAVLGIALTARNNLQKQVEKPEKPKEIASDQKPPLVLGKNTQEVEDLKGEEVTLFVPEESVVSVFIEPKLDSEVLTTVEVSQKVLQVSSQDGWVRIVVTADGKKVAGWVDQDFIESEDKDEVKEELKKSISRIFQLVTIADTPTGFLRVRSGPWGQELGKVEPGSKYPVLDSKNGWSQIVLDDGSLGWVYDKYILSDKTARGSPN